MQRVTRFTSATVVLPDSNIDTDRIIPARFLTTTSRAGLGRHLFADWRYDAAGAPRSDFVLNHPESAGRRILICGHNFGCGSSREHASWALLDHGFQAVISTEIADIFKSNALKNGLVPIEVDEGTSRWLMEHPGCELTIDVAQGTLRLPTGSVVGFALERFARHCLLNGIDELGFLLERRPEITRYERAHNR